MMPRSLAILLENCLDYAGMFPPARLDSKSAFENYLRYRRGAERIFVRSFVCPVSALKDLPQSTNDEVALSVIGTRAESSIRESVVRDFVVLREFSETHSKNYRVRSYEIRADEIRAGSPLEIRDTWFRELHRMFPGVLIFVEVPYAENTLSDSLALLKSQNLFGKVRIAEGDSVLSGKELARWVSLCANLRLPFKATAGLHHPIHESERGVYQHGFLNLFCAGTIAYFGGDESAIRSILECEDSSEFRFLEDAFEVLGHRAEIPRIREARGWLISFGSCSVDEPLEGLEALKYWKKTHAEIQQ